MGKSGMVEDEDVRKRGANEVQDKAENPKSGGQ